jgi:acyl-CoA synthetase (AMP-forming)/AMP-acid ligase II
VDLARNLIGRINVGDSLTRTAVSRPDQLAVVDGDRRAELSLYVGHHVLPEGVVGSHNGKLLPPGQAGEIVYRGPSTMSGYLHDEEATDKAFAHGWFHSGDVGYFGDDGVLWFTDRHKDVIKTGGENVASIEVEKAIYAADARVSEVVVVGLPHQRWSEAITAFIVPKPGETIDGAELIAALKARLDGFKVPKAVIFVDQLPKTSTGKIQKNVVRSDYAKHYEEG